MAKFLDKCKICGNYFTNYDIQPTRFCSVLCHVTNIFINEPINEPIEDLPVGEIRSSKSVKVKEDK